MAFLLLHEFQITFVPVCIYLFSILITLQRGHIL